MVAVLGVHGVLYVLWAYRMAGGKEVRKDGQPAFLGIFKESQGRSVDGFGGDVGSMVKPALSLGR
mgnify:CR=1 FL=1